MTGPTPAHAQAPTPTPTPTPFTVAAPSRANGSTVARLVAPAFARHDLRAAKSGRRLGTTTSWSAQPQALLVLEGATFEGQDWVKVLLPTRPNGSTGWVPRDRVALGRSRYWITVRLRTRRVTVYRDGKRVRSFRAVIGARATPTPLGLAAIYERNRQPNPRVFVGPWVLSLTSLSNVLESYGGGPGRVAIHGRSGASLRDPLGSARSHGCMRVNNRDVRWLATRVPAGTPVHVRR
ncbi:L,D-transpeptidase [Solirubrobacter deserti]|uniref:L,D-transpeptidase n=1 Tax=Solirubrobacter deserti TaxID=2282478 RepID=A0ABT4RKH6_9ACTN|nr:L,D-transpeptidase [Solirubrobacter deserti]MDA0139022.1 L,D-transpeptidase [Solirubrobacter deserti]